MRKDVRHQEDHTFLYWLKEANELHNPLNDGCRSTDWIVVAIAGADHGAMGDKPSGAASFVVPCYATCVGVGGAAGG